MRVPHSAKLSLVALALTALMAGCGGDSNAPDAPFDASGTSSDINAIEASFESPATSGFVAASAAISAVLGDSPAAVAVKAMPTKSLFVGGKPAARRYAGTLAKAFLKPASTTAAVIDEQYLGVTFTFDPETDEYGPSELTGAPEDGVRFIVYAVNPISGVPIEPLVEIGYADIVTTETASSATVRVELVSDDVTYLDYSVATAQSTSLLTVIVSGFVSNGEDRVDFDLDNRFTSGSIELDYNLSVPTRGGFRIDYEGVGTANGVTTTLEARGPHGTVTISGSETASAGTFEVEVNGDLFATINTVQGEEPVITGAGGDPLTQAEGLALLAVFAVFFEGFDFFEDVLDPLS